MHFDYTDLASKLNRDQYLDRVRLSVTKTLYKINTKLANI